MNLSGQATRELHALLEKDAQVAPRLLKAADEGRIEGLQFVNEERTCGCLYGWAANLEYWQACDLLEEARSQANENAVIRERWAGRPAQVRLCHLLMTPLERYVASIHVGDTPRMTPALHALVQEIKEWQRARGARAPEVR